MASTTSPRWASLPSGLGAMLRHARIDAGLSRQALSAAVLASPGCLGALEAEQRPPSTTVADRITAALQLDAWHAALLGAVAVEEAQLRTRRGVRHVNRRGAPLSDELRERIADERARGRSWRAIAGGLNHDGLPSRQGRLWWASSVRDAAQSPVPTRGLPSQRSTSSK